MASGGYRPGAGRPKKGEMTVKDIMQKFDNPLEYMLAIMNDPEIEPSRRDKMAIAAAPFIHPKAGESGKKEKLADAAEKASAGRFKPSEPPKLVHSR